jgi:hypothetical protein
MGWTEFAGTAAQEFITSAAEQPDSFVITVDERSLFHGVNHNGFGRILDEGAIVFLAFAQGCHRFDFGITKRRLLLRATSGRTRLRAFLCGGVPVGNDPGHCCAQLLWEDSKDPIGIFRVDAHIEMSFNCCGCGFDFSHSYFN